MLIQKILDALFPAGGWKFIYDYVCNTEFFRQPVKAPGQPPESMMYVFMIGFVWLGLFPFLIYCFVRVGKAFIKRAGTKDSAASADESKTTAKMYREESAAGKNAFLVMGTSGIALGSLIASWFISRVCAANAAGKADRYVSFALGFSSCLSFSR